MRINPNRPLRDILMLAAGVLTVAALSLVPGNPAVAQKKGGGGGGSTPPPPGTVLFDVLVDGGTADWHMEHWGATPGGTGAKIAFRHTFEKNSSDVVPSALVYGTDPVLHRWWLAVGEFQRDDGKVVREVFASRLDGDGNLQSLQLTALYPHVYLFPNQLQVGWSNDGADSFLSFKGRTFGQETHETPREEHDLSDDLTHVFRLNLSGEDIQACYDLGIEPMLGIDAIADGWIDSVLEVGGQLAIYEASIDAHHWSPGGSAIVYRMPDGLWVATLDPNGPVAHGGGATSHIWEAPMHDVSPPQWSPDGQRIAFSEGGRVRTVKPDGTGAVLVLDEGTYSYGLPVWSPDSAHLAVVQYRQKGFNSESHISRVPAAGGPVTVLTGDLDKSLSKTPVGWVSNALADAP